MITATQIVAHLAGDYLLQSDWMANSKTKQSLPALAHAIVYTLPFLFLTFAWKALAVICLTHFIIDRFRLARYVCWVKNFLAPPHSDTDGTRWWYSWKECDGTGYPNERTAKVPWMTVWLMIIADNTIHLIINGAAIYFLG